MQIISGEGFEAVTCSGQPGGYGSFFQSGRNMTSQSQVASNQRNSLNSTGPKTPEGRLKSSMNALKHGRRSKMQALLRDESFAFENRRDRGMASADPHDDMGEFRSNPASPGADSCGIAGRSCARNWSPGNSGDHPIGSRPYACWAASPLTRSWIGASPRFSWPAMPSIRLGTAPLTTS